MWIIIATVIVHVCIDGTQLESRNLKLRLKIIIDHCTHNYYAHIRRYSSVAVGTHLVELVMDLVEDQCLVVVGRVPLHNIMYCMEGQTIGN